MRGRDMSGRPAHVYAAMGVARTFQLTQLFGRMTVLENLLVPGLTRPRSRGRPSRGTRAATSSS